MIYRKNAILSLYAGIVIIPSYIYKVSEDMKFENYKIIAIYNYYITITKIIYLIIHIKLNQNIFFSSWTVDKI